MTDEFSPRSTTTSDFSQPLKEAVQDAIADGLLQPKTLTTFEPASDPVAAAHGAKKFQPHFADAEVQAALDKAAVAGMWYVAIHFIASKEQSQPDGTTRLVRTLNHFFKPSDRFPNMENFHDGETGRDDPAIAHCAVKCMEDAKKRLAAMREQAIAGLSGLANFGPNEPIEDERD